MALDPEAARDPGLPRGQGPAALLRRRGHRLYNPRLQLRYAITRRHPDHADRRGGDGRRRRARSASWPRPRPRASPRPSTRRPRRSRRGAPGCPRHARECSTLTAGLPEQVADAAGRARGCRRAPRRRAGRAGRRASAWAAAAWPATSWRRSPAPLLPVPVLVVKSYECPAFVRRRQPGLRRLGLGQHRGDAAGRDRRRRCRGPPWSPSPAAGELAAAGRRVGRPDHRRPAATCPSPAPPSAPCRSRRWWCSRRWACYRGGRLLDRARPSTSSSAAATDLAARATPARRRPSPGASAAPSRSSTGAGRSAPPPPSGGRPRSTRTPRRRRSGAPSPSCATTRSAGGASTATSPASSSPLVALRHDAEHPQVGRRFDLVGELVAGGGGRRDRGPGRGRRRPGPAVRPDPVRATTCRCGWPPRRGSTRVRSRSSTGLKAALASP